MELLEFKNRFLDLCRVTEVKEVSEVLRSVVLDHNTNFFDDFESMIDDTKDWLQALWQYYEADRAEKKQDYTPKSICKLVSVLAGDCKSVYDCCGGSGALTLELIKNRQIDSVYVEELDERVMPFLLFNLCLNNASGFVVNGDVLSREAFTEYRLQKGEKYSECYICEAEEDSLCDVAISNPPYNIKWQPPMLIESDNRFPIIPPSSNANYAFALHCLSKAKKAILILPNGVMSQENEREIRQYLVENDLIETVISLPDKMFEVTTIGTCVIVLNRNKTHKRQVMFIDSRQNYVTEEREQNGQFGGASHTNRTYKKEYKVLSDKNINKIIKAIEEHVSTTEFSAAKTTTEIAKNDYLLMPSRYIEFAEKETKHRDYQDIADNLNFITRILNSCKLTINESLAKDLGLEVEAHKANIKNSQTEKRNMKAIGIEIIADDYISFSKNKNEFVFKCNDKEAVPILLRQFYVYWNQQMHLLTEMQNSYLIELRDALLPDLLSGKIDVSNIQIEGA